MLGKILGHALAAGFHAAVALPPSSRAELAVLLMQLERIHHADPLIHIASQRQVVDQLMRYNSVIVNEKNGFSRVNFAEPESKGKQKKMPGTGDAPRNRAKG
jgi:hypothetical protein